MVSVLEDWDSRCMCVLDEIEGQVREIRRKAQEQRKRETEHEKAVAKKMGENEDGKGKLGKRGGGEEADEMDIDEGGRRLRFAHFGVIFSYREPRIESQGTLREQEEHFALGTYLTTLIFGLKKQC